MIENDYGPCCVCRCLPTEENSVSTIVNLNLKAPVPGTGWGDLLWKLPCDGAIAIICDRCVAREDLDIQDVVYGYANEKVRYAYSALQEPFGDRVPESTLLEFDFQSASVFDGVLALPNWKNDETDIIRNVILHFYENDLSLAELRFLKRYLQYWMDFDWAGDREVLERLRKDLPEISDRNALLGWIEDLALLGIDPM